MAYSPSPQPAALAAAGNSRIFSRPSPSPPTSQAVSKRDKRKNALTDRLRDISTNFANNRDFIYRQQLQTYQVAMSYITEADPYDDKPLDDLSDNIIENINKTVSSNSQGGQRAAPVGSQPRFQAPPRAGKWAATFVQEVNAAMEERDAQLTLVAERHNHKIHELQEDREFMIEVARTERNRLMSTVRHRLIHSVNANKNLLNREKDKFDITGENALRFYPNHFSITNPASPGGPQSNRKTRHTRHRIDVDDLSAVGESNKRKRKAPADAENDFPGPSGRAVEAEVPQAWRDVQDAREAHQSAPLYTIDRLFSERELEVNLRTATLEAVNHFSNKRLRTNGDSQYIPSGDAHTNMNALEYEEDDDDDANAVLDDAAVADKGDNDNEDLLLTAPEMDRTANNSVYVTRSTRTLNPEAPSALGDMAGRKSGANLIGTQKKTKAGDDQAKGGPPLNDVEVNEDLAMIAAAIKDEEENTGKNNKQMLQVLVPDRQDHVSAAVTVLPNVNQAYVSNIRPAFVVDKPLENIDDLYNFLV